MTSKIVGGILKEAIKPSTVEAVKVTWKYINKEEGLIQWSFENTSNEMVNFALLRQGYYFGNAFYPVYLENPEFQTSFTTVADKPMSTTGNPPVAVVYFSGKPIVCFVFTLVAKQIWTMEEGGWTDQEPTSYQAVPLTPVSVKKFSIQYNPEQVTQWDEQSGTDYAGYSPNPKVFSSMKFISAGQYISIFPDESITVYNPSNNSTESPLEEFEKLIEMLLKALEGNLFNL